MTTVCGACSMGLHFECDARYTGLMEGPDFVLPTCSCECATPDANRGDNAERSQ